MSLFKKWFLGIKDGDDDSSEYARDFYRSHAIDDERYQNHPYARRLYRWACISLEKPEEGEDV